MNPDIQGYGGHFRIHVTLDKNYKILEVKMLDHKETYSYVGYQLNKFFAQFIGKSNGDHFEIGHDIDAMTHATISSRAFTSSIDQGIQKIQQTMNPAAAVHKTHHTASAVELAIPLLLYILAISAVVRASQFLRWTTMIIALFYLGILKGSMLSIITLGNIGLGHLPNFSDNPLWWMLISLNILTLLFYKNVYCASICPFLAVQDMANAARLKLRIRPFPIAPKSSLTKYLILLSIIILIFLYRNTDVVTVEPYILLFAGHKFLWSMLFVGILLIASFFIYRFWCRIFCPFGAFQDLIQGTVAKRLSAAKKNINNQQKQKLWLFWLFYSVTIVFILLTINANIRIISQNQHQVIMVQKLDSDKIENNLKQHGIKPQTAKYWKSSM
ncbi:MAG: FMN-binding protein [Candidatus Omnitrophica bacterium]|nr:FMN-binding protein [Candidatus Omnitrophota bacterium]